MTMPHEREEDVLVRDSSFRFAAFGMTMPHESEEDVLVRDSSFRFAAFGMTVPHEREEDALVRDSSFRFAAFGMTVPPLKKQREMCGGSKPVPSVGNSRRRRASFFLRANAVISSERSKRENPYLHEHSPVIPQRSEESRTIAD